MERRQSKASAAEQSYRRNIVETNERQRRYFQQDLRDALDNLQQLETDRIVRTKEVLMSYVLCAINLADNMKSRFEQMTHSTKQIDHERDVNGFIAENRTGEPMPEDMGFMPYNPSLGRAPSYGVGAASTTKGSLLGKRELQASDLENMPIDRQAKVLQSKIKELELERVEIERRKIDAELRMGDVGPTESYQQDQLRSTLDAYSRNIERLQEDIDRYQNWLHRVEYGESIQPTPMTTVNVPATSGSATIGGLATASEPERASGSETFSGLMPTVRNPELQYETNVTSEEQFDKHQKQRGIVDRVMESIFHPREP